MLFRFVAFANELRDAVANVTVARGPGTFPVVGPLSAGGLGRQRLNLGRVRAEGLELTAAWRPAPGLTVNADLLLNNAVVRSAPVARALEGRRLAQVPRRSGAISVAWRGPGRWFASARTRLIGRQFEDDENQLVLGAVVVTDAALSRPLNAWLEAFLAVENAADARIETARGADGVVSVAGPRSWRGGIRARW